MAEKVNKIEEQELTTVKEQQSKIQRVHGEVEFL